MRTFYICYVITYHLFERTHIFDILKHKHTLLDHNVYLALLSFGTIKSKASITNDDEQNSKYKSISPF